jgi:hypothetical protein
METITEVIEFQVVVEEDKMIEAEVEIGIDPIEMEEVGEEVMKEKQESALSLRIQVLARGAIIVILNTSVEEEIQVRIVNLEEMGAATVEVEEMEAEEEEAKQAISLAPSQLILRLHQDSQYRLKPITSGSKLLIMVEYIYTKSIGVLALTLKANT